jgi:hypothetical protein
MQKGTKRKVYKKTKGVSHKGVCGHDYISRIGLGTLAGKFVSKKNNLELENRIATHKKFMSELVCGNCLATELLENVEKSNKGILDSLGLPALPPISGSLGQRAWAERIRNDHLRHLIYWATSSTGSTSILEYINTSDKDSPVDNENIKVAVDNFKKTKEYVEGESYLGRLLASELDTGSDRTVLKRLLITRYILDINMRFFSETRHTAWIMYEKRGNGSHNVRLIPIPPTVFYTISHLVYNDLENISEYEKAINSLSKRATRVDKELLETIPDSHNPLEKAELLGVYYKLSGHSESSNF